MRGINLKRRILHIALITLFALTCFQRKGLSQGGEVASSIRRQAKMKIRRFNKIDRFFHIFLIISFLIQTGTGFSRLFITTPWGEKLVYLFGGYESASLIHRRTGTIMICGFILHILYLLMHIDLKNPLKTFFGPDSLIPDLKDFQHLWQKL